jgi:transposase
MSKKLDSTIAVVGIDIGKNSFHVVGHDERGAIVLRQEWSRVRWKLGSRIRRHV